MSPLLLSRSSACRSLCSLGRGMRTFSFGIDSLLCVTGMAVFEGARDDNALLSAEDSEEKAEGIIKFKEENWTETFRHLRICAKWSIASIKNSNICSSAQGGGRTPLLFNFQIKPKKQVLGGGYLPGF